MNVTAICTGYERFNISVSGVTVYRNATIPQVTAVIVSLAKMQGKEIPSVNISSSLRGVTEKGFSREYTI
jgi:hypothetical protein